MTGKRAPGPDVDSALWQRIAGTVRPLKRRSAAPSAAKPAAQAGGPADTPRREAAAPEASRGREPGRGSPAPLTAGAAVGLDKRTAQRLRRGQIRIEGRLDLHGMTRAEAHRNLLDFLESSTAAGRRCVLVITGKGMRTGAGSGILREELPRWLNESALRPLVLGFAGAQPRDGGGGAFYLYLRRERLP